jgi:cell division protein FtsL
MVFAIFLKKMSSIIPIDLIKKETEKICIVLITVVSVFLVFVIMYKANWTFSDDHEYIRTTAVNNYLPFEIWDSRFFPLGHIHYNLPLFIFNCLGINTGLPVQVHYLMISLFCVVSVLCLYFLFKKIEPLPNVNHPFLSLFFACSFFMLGNTFPEIFMNLIFPEAQGIMLLSLFMLMYYKALKTDIIKYYIISFIACAYNTYCKETVFVTFLVIALTNLVFRYKDISKREKIFYFTLIVNGILFLGLYYFLVYKNVTAFYNEGRVTLDRFQIFLSVLKENPILIIMFLFGFIRLFFVLFKKDRMHLYYDCLLFSGMSYLLTYIILNLMASYYFMPSIILFLPSLVYWIKYAFSKIFILGLCLFIGLFSICLYNFGNATKYVKNAWHERQVFMPYITNLLSEYNNYDKFIWYESDNKLTENTYYAAYRKWQKHILNAFLKKKKKTKKKEFFITIKPHDYFDISQNILFFYSACNDQWQPMQDVLVSTLQENNFILYEDYRGIFVYKRKKKQK